MHFLPKKQCFWAKKALFLPKDLQKVRKSQQFLICDKIAYVWAKNFRPSPNFLAGAPRPCPGFHPYNIQKKIQILTNQWLQGDRTRKFKYSKSVFFKDFFLFWSTKRKKVFCFASPSSIELGKTITTITTATTGIFFFKPAYFLAQRTWNFGLFCPFCREFTHFLAYFLQS